MNDRLNRLLKFHETDPNDTFCTFGIAMEYMKHGDYAQCVAWFDKTTDLDANYIYAYYQKARALIASGDPVQARQVIGQGLDAARRVNDLHAAEELKVLADSLD